MKGVGEARQTSMRATFPQAAELHKRIHSNHIIATAAAAAAAAASCLWGNRDFSLSNFPGIFSI